MDNQPTKKQSGMLPVLNIQSMIFTVRGVQVMVDRDLAAVPAGIRRSAKKKSNKR